MGHKAIITVDMDHLDIIEKNPEMFVEQLKRALLTHKRLGGDVYCKGASVANVIEVCHSSNAPTIRFKDFGGQIID